MKKLHDDEMSEQRAVFERAFALSGLPRDEAIGWLAEKVAVHPMTVRKYLSGQRAGEKLLALVSALSAGGPALNEQAASYRSDVSALARRADYVLKRGNIDQVKLLTSVIQTLHDQVSNAPAAQPIVFETKQAQIPLIGSIAAGIPVDSEQYRSEHFVLLPERKAKGADFALRVSGESMIGAGVHHGDIVLFAQRAPHDGEIVAARMDGECTLKRFRKSGRGDKEKWWLEAANPAFPAVLSPKAELEIQGVMIGKL